jgi:hypothetical protein
MEPGPIPALLTRMSMRPNRARVALVISSADGVVGQIGLDGEQVLRLALSWVLAASASKGSRSRSTPATLMPAANKPRVIALPMPPAAPVTIATRWISFMVCFLSVLCPLSYFGFEERALCYGRSMIDIVECAAYLDPGTPRRKRPSSLSRRGLAPKLQKITEVQGGRCW